MEKRARNWLSLHHGKVHRLSEHELLGLSRGRPPGMRRGQQAAEIAVLLAYLFLFVVTWFLLLG